MHVVKPSWLVHGGELRDHEVYSCHISPDGSRLVTAAGDAHIRIWSTEAIYNSHDPSYIKPKQLAALSTHSGTIHAVRFSSNNKYLASGADDKIVCIYALDPGAPAHAHAFGSNEPPPVENWRVLRRLVGHDNDVQDLGWSYDSSILVSVGLDSKVVVWSGHTFEKLKLLPQHQSHVKGITFDPANKYFATASDDRTIKIFRFTSPPPNATAHDQINNFILETTIAAPFTSSPLTTYFRRCSWSPDGNHIAAANAVNGPVSSVAIINRGSWDSDISLIGHEGPVEVCVFSPRMFYKEPHNPNNVDAHGNNLQASVTVVACAGQDKSLSVWNTNYARPFVIAQELSTKSISDIAWSPDGEKLIFTSLDGGITAIMFQPGELGYPAPVQEIERALTKYGAGRKAGIAEGPDALRLEELSKAGELKGVQGRMGQLMGDGAVQATPPRVNGNTFVNGTGSASTTNGLATEPAPAPTQPPSQDVKTAQLKQRVEIVNGRKRVKPLLLSSSSAASISTLPQAQLVTGATTTAGAKENIPHSILDLNKPYEGLPKPGLAAILFGSKRKYAEIEGDEERRAEKKIASAAKDGAVPIVVNSVDGLLPPSAAAPKQTNALPGPLSPIIDPALTFSTVRLATPVHRSIIMRTNDGTAPPKPVDTSTAPGTTTTTEPVPSVPTNDDTVLFEARNATGASRTGRVQDRDPTRINCTKQGQTLWQDYLPRAVTLVTGNKHFWAAGCDDGSIYLWTPAGRRHLNALILEAQPVVLECYGWNLLVVSSVGLCRVINVRTQKAPHPPVSLAPVLDQAMATQGPHLSAAPAIVGAGINSEGRIVVSMSNGDGFMYNSDLCAWARLSEVWWAVGSQYWNTSAEGQGSGVVVGKLASVVGQGNGAANGVDGKKKRRRGRKRRSAAATAASAKDDEDDDATDVDDTVAPEHISAGIIPYLERNTTRQTLLRGRAYYLQRLVKALLVAEGFEGLEANVSVAHLENRLAAALALGARDEFKVYLLQYAKRIGAVGLRAKCEELLRSLMGGLPFDAVEEDESWFGHGEEICGWRRRELVREVVVVLGKYRDLQRLTVQYARLLGVVEEQQQQQLQQANQEVKTPERDPNAMTDL